MKFQRAPGGGRADARQTGLGRSGRAGGVLMEKEAAGQQIGLGSRRAQRVTGRSLGDALPRSKEATATRISVKPDGACGRPAQGMSAGRHAASVDRD